jgi:hypothetical protein
LLVVVAEQPPRFVHSWLSWPARSIITISRVAVKRNLAKAACFARAKLLLAFSAKKTYNFIRGMLLGGC